MPRPSSAKNRDHIDPEEILTLAEGARPSAASRTHLERCEPCRVGLSDAEAMVGDLRAEGIVEPPLATLQRAIELFPATPPLAQRVRDTVARMVRGGDAFALAAPGLRGDTATPARLLFEGVGIEVDVELVADRGAFQVSGMVLAHSQEAKALLAWAEVDGRQLGEVAVSDLGTFVLDRVPPRDFDLVLDFGSSRLRLPIKPEAQA